ncbi:MAG: TetR/AcrR family transcriptional regulator [Nitrospirae bacterium]|nr:TetR/AcrR family transcriptional regulator [Nitrospirota bacterium]
MTKINGVKQKINQDRTSERPAWLPILPDPRDEEILGAAFHVFSERGFYEATMLEIARCARASKATLYARFQNKSGLFKALLEWGARRYLGISNSIEKDSAIDPKEALIHYTTLILEISMQAEALALFRIAVAESRRSPQIGRIYSNTLKEHCEGVLSTIAEQLVRAGQLGRVDASEFSDVLLGLLRGELFYRAILGTETSPSAGQLKKRARRAVELTLRAFPP